MTAATFSKAPGKENIRCLPCEVAALLTTWPMQAPRRFGHVVSKAATSQGRHRIFSLPGAFENVAAVIYCSTKVSSLSRDADRILNLIVIRLEVVVGDRPVLQGCSRWDGRLAVTPGSLATNFEIPSIQAPA